MSEKKKTKLNSLDANEEINPDDLLQQGFRIIQNEIQKLADGADDCMSREAASTLNDYMRTLIQLKKENRYASIEQDLEQLEEHDFNQLAKEAMKYLSHDTSKQGRE